MMMTMSTRLLTVVLASVSLIHQPTNAFVPRSILTTAGANSIQPDAPLTPAKMSPANGRSYEEQMEEYNNNNNGFHAEDTTRRYTPSPDDWRTNERNAAFRRAVEAQQQRQQAPPPAFHTVPQAYHTQGRYAPTRRQFQQQQHQQTQAYDDRGRPIPPDLNQWNNHNGQTQQRQLYTNPIARSPPVDPNEYRQQQRTAYVQTVYDPEAYWREQRNRAFQRATQGRLSVPPQQPPQWQETAAPPPMAEEPVSNGANDVLFPPVPEETESLVPLVPEAEISPMGAMGEAKNDVTSEMPPPMEIPVEMMSSSPPATADATIPSSIMAGIQSLDEAVAAMNQLAEDVPSTPSTVPDAAAAVPPPLITLPVAKASKVIEHPVKQNAPPPIDVKVTDENSAVVSKKATTTPATPVDEELKLPIPPVGSKPVVSADDSTKKTPTVVADAKPPPTAANDKVVPATVIPPRQQQRPAPRVLKDTIDTTFAPVASSFEQNKKEPVADAKVKPSKDDSSATVDPPVAKTNGVDAKKPAAATDTTKVPAVAKQTTPPTKAVPKQQTVTGAKRPVVTAASQKPNAKVPVASAKTPVAAKPVPSVTNPTVVAAKKADAEKTKVSAAKTPVEAKSAPKPSASKETTTKSDAKPATVASAGPTSTVVPPPAAKKVPVTTSSVSKPKAVSKEPVVSAKPSKVKPAQAKQASPVPKKPAFVDTKTVAAKKTKAKRPVVSDNKAAVPAKPISVPKSKTKAANKSAAKETTVASSKSSLSDEPDLAFFADEKVVGPGKNDLDAMAVDFAAAAIMNQSDVTTGSSSGMLFDDDTEKLLERAMQQLESTQKEMSDVKEMMIQSPSNTTASTSKPRTTKPPLPKEAPPKELMKESGVETTAAAKAAKSKPTVTSSSNSTVLAEKADLLSGLKGKSSSSMVVASDTTIDPDSRWFSAETKDGVEPRTLQGVALATAFLSTFVVGSAPIVTAAAVPAAAYLAVCRGTTGNLARELGNLTMNCVEPLVTTNATTEAVTSAAKLVKHGLSEISSIKAPEAVKKYLKKPFAKDRRVKKATRAAKTKTSKKNDKAARVSGFVDERLKQVELAKQELSPEIAAQLKKDQENATKARIANNSSHDTELNGLFSNDKSQQSLNGKKKRAANKTIVNRKKDSEVALDEVRAAVMTKVGEIDEPQPFTFLDPAARAEVNARALLAKRLELQRLEANRMKN